MKTIQFRIIDQTLGGDIWTCNDPPAKMTRYKLTRVKDGEIIDGSQYDTLLPEIYIDFDEARKRVDELNEEDFAKYFRNK